MAYTLNGVDLTEYGLYPARADKSNIAIQGCWDMPARIGTTSHDWGDENGIESYLEEGMIFFGGRDIVLNLYLKGESKLDATNKLSTFYRDINAFTDLVTLSTSWGDFDVYVNDKIDVNYMREGLAKIKISFREPVCDLSGTLPANISAAFGISGYSFASLGLVPLAISGQLDRPSAKPQLFKSYETEGYQITPRKERESVLTCLMLAEDYDAFKSYISALYKLFSLTQEHTLDYYNDVERPFYVRDGFKVESVNVRDKVYGLIKINITETGIMQPSLLLTDDSTVLLLAEGLGFIAGQYYQTEF
ncbi:MAG: hypothetical protein ACTHLB_05465 [Parafilimonas sp.]